MKDDEEYDLVTVRRARGGVVKRETKLGREIAVKSQFHVKSGDFLISKRQIVHGACGIVPPELDGATVSNEYAVLRSHDTLDLAYLKYLSHSIYFQQTCFHSAIGVHIEKMIFKLEEWLEWEFDLPPVPEQIRIAKLLNTWDEAFAVGDRLIQNALKQKAALLHELVVCSPSTRKAGLTREEFRIDEIATKRAEGFSGISSEARRCLELEHIEPETGFILAETNTAETDSTKLEFSETSVLFGKLRPYLRKFAFPGFHGVCSSEFWVLDAKRSVCLPQYLFYAVQSAPFLRAAGVSSGSKMPRADWGYVKDATIKIPGLREQRSIVSKLAAADAVIRCSKDFFAQLHAERAALIQKLLSGKHRTKALKEAA
ncbi:MAG: restriction endonuclease subunit S [Pirellulaceae bacterium]